MKGEEGELAEGRALGLPLEVVVGGVGLVTLLLAWPL